MLENKERINNHIERKVNSLFFETIQYNSVQYKINHFTIYRQMRWNNLNI